MGPRISIALATFNGERFLNEQLDSLERQIAVPFELVVADDGSTDNTLALVERFAAGAPFPVRIIRNSSRLGYRANFMKAANLCEGELIAFCDQDDVWREDKLAKVEAAFNDPTVLMVHHDAEIVDRAGRHLGVIYGASRRPKTSEPLSVLPWDTPLGFTLTFRRSLLPLSGLRCGIEDWLVSAERLAHDHWIGLLAATLGRTTYLCDCLAQYRQHDANVFGVRRASGLWRRSRELIQRLIYISDYALLERICSGFALVLRKIGEGESDFANHAIKAADLFGLLAPLYGMRHEAYSAQTVGARFGAWRRLILAGAYSGAQRFRFYRKELGRDLILGVMCARLQSDLAGVDGRDFSLRVPVRG